MSSTDSSIPEPPRDDVSAIRCHVCQKMILRKGTAKYFQEPLRRCLLCNKTYCASHGSPSYANPTPDMEDGVCEINHHTYFRKHPSKPNVYMSIEHRTRTLEDPSK
ncbi:MAG: hypothetical protein BYD32DRAFT_415350 [Podila humilis]|nr:MAG: hypothetical protein BYD32DRAFT_415350 [Podila humilis]